MPLPRPVVRLTSPLFELIAVGIDDEFLGVLDDTVLTDLDILFIDDAASAIIKKCLGSRNR